MKKNRILLITAAMLLVFPAAGEETFSFSSDTTKAILIEGKEETILSGNAGIISGSTEISGDEIRLFGKDFRYAVGRGNLRIKDEEQGIIIRCQSLFYDRDEDITRVKGYNEMEDYKNELVVKSNFLENHGRDINITYIQIGVRILKATDDEEMICTAEYAVYFRDTDILELTGFPEVTWKGDHYSASRILIDLEKDEITLEGDVAGTVSSDEEESADNTNEAPGNSGNPQNSGMPDSAPDEPVPQPAEEEAE